MSGTGRIVLRVEDDSMFLSNNLPYVVRDARHSVVATGTTSHGIDDPLPLGLYSVEVMTPRGRERTRLVQVTAEEPVRLVVIEDGLRVDGPPAPPRFGMRDAGEPDARLPPPVAALVDTRGTRRPPIGDPSH